MVLGRRQRDRFQVKLKSFVLFCFLFLDLVTCELSDDIHLIWLVTVSCYVCLWEGAKGLPEGTMLSTY